ncbi:P-loop containing nucleoside triphosphate hydrolases superfamily protein [Rhynchospora pubera]|uniref:P-loop containing nucleoside triphosphate hydrolases superfamily protein n=1 Tax=Rhynchospora pubera TaxID=906938 RepID=A0AAV8E1R9_9POAL|nr:P-loop containing nucleoside triphosphate hydrolases superfamily protein [Rhynchospora pubera]
MATESLLASVVEDVLNQHQEQGPTMPSLSLSLDRDLVSRRQEEAASRRNEAAAWLRRTVGVVAARDLPEEPSEEEFRLGLRSGIILCNALNKLYPATIPKVVEAPTDFTPSPDGAALSAYQYFENVRNFLVALQDFHLPTFEASDLEKGGKAARVVNCVLALKSHSERTAKSLSTNANAASASSSSSSTKYFVRKNSEPFMNSLFRSQSSDGISLDHNLTLDFSIESSQITTSPSLLMLVSTMLSNKKPEEVPELVGSIISKVLEECERRMSTQNEMALVEKVETKCNEMEKVDTKCNEMEKVETKCNEMEKDEIVSKEKQAAPILNADQQERVIQIEEVQKNFNEMNNDENLSREKQATPILHIDRQEREIQIPKVDKSCHEMNNDENVARKKQAGLILEADRQERQIKELRQMLCNVKSGMENMRLQYHDQFTNLGRHLGKLSHAASGHRKVLEENRKLYNLLQDLKGNIRVYCRVRPQKMSTPTPVLIEDDHITIITPSKHSKEGRKSFRFNRVFGPSATQEEVFSDMQPLIRSVLDGYNVCIFAYGQTGSGKTHTMTGPKELTEETRGVNYRALNDLFHISETRRDTFSYEISVQMMEIYNEQVRDLLATGGINKKLEIRSSSQNGGLAVPDANIVPVSTTSEVIELMNLGHKNRAVSSTAMNDRSSRSHSCLTVHVQGRDLMSGAVLRGSMHLVDLAGSERLDKTGAKGDCLKEATYINKSLSALGDVIASLAQKNSHVPYRNSKLTQLLQDSLGGQAKTLMFVHISPEYDAAGESLSTLKFAERVATVELGAAHVNKDGTEVKELKKQLANLKAQLAMKEAGQVERIRSPDIYQTKSGTITAAQPSIRQPMEDVGNIEMRSNLPTTQKKPNLDTCEMASESDSASWIDQIVIENSNNENINLSNCPSMSSSVTGSIQRYPSDVSIAYQDFDCATITRSETGGSEDSDELELSTSYCSSEHDMMMTWQSDIPKVPSLGNGSSNNGIGSRLKKPQAKLATSPDIRSANRAHKPSPSRKIQNALSQTPGKLGNGKRTAAGKTGKGK